MAQVDFQRRQLTVSGKGAKRARIVATKRLLESLKILDRAGDRVFGVSRRRVQRLFDRLCIRAEVRGRGYHALRHSCGTRLYSLTRDLLSSSAIFAIRVPAYQRFAPTWQKEHAKRQ